VHMGQRFDADGWFTTVKRGTTFVTGGPMLEFTVSGHLPGEDLAPAKGERLRIHAKAMVGSSVVRMERLEVVANGEVVRSAPVEGNAAELDFELPADKSLWTAARVAMDGHNTIPWGPGRAKDYSLWTPATLIGAHTTPVYVTVDRKRHWNRDQVPALLEQRLRVLDDVDKLIADNGAGIGPGVRGTWENADSFRRGTARMREAVQEAREAYRQLRHEWEAER
jgi:hypothetical protein